MKKVLTKLSNGEEVSLSGMSVNDLKRLHFDEECIFCEKALRLPPFSLERTELLNEGYEFVSKIKDEIAEKEGFNTVNEGASKKSVKLLKRLLTDKLLDGGCVLYEAGVGRGHAIQQVLDWKHFNPKNLQIKGCDVFIQPSMQSLIEANPALEITQGHILDCIRRLPDNTIDLFYADSVIEHFVPDEAEIIFAEITKKLKQNAYVYAIIPNKYLGPGDVSMYFLPFGSKALGTHFMEMSFSEVTDAMKKHNIKHSQACFSIPATSVIFNVKSKALIKFKIAIEPYIAKIPLKFLRRLVFAFGAYNVSVMKKELICNEYK